jgi:effector-binding domain-containing protein
MSNEVTIQEIPEQHVLSLRTRSAVASLPALMGKVYGSIAAYLEANKAFPAGPPFAAYFNMEMDDLDIEIGMPVAVPLPGTGEFGPGVIPGGRYASLVHVGPYDKLAPAYQALTTWMEENGQVPSGVAYEHYLNDPQGTPPEALQTEIRFALLD